MRHRVILCIGGFIMLWNMQELLQLIKDDLDLTDLPNVLTDEMLQRHIELSSLKEMSIIYPRIEKFKIGTHDMVHPEDMYAPKHRGIEYNIPKWFLMQFKPVTLIDVDPISYNESYGSLLPYSIGYEPDDLIGAVAGVKAMAGMSGNIVNSPTPEYDNARQVIKIYSGWSENNWEVTMGVQHDPNLQTIPDTAAITFRQLATYDTGAYIYSKIFRKDGVETGVGSITLNLDKLRDCQQKHDDLLKDLMDEVSLDMDTVEFF